VSSLLSLLSADVHRQVRRGSDLPDEVALT
jgi:hypothetical protein